MNYQIYLNIQLSLHPNHKQDIINNVHLIRANPNLVIMVIVFSSGHVEHVHLATDIPFSNDKLNTISNFVTNKLTEFNRKFSGVLLFCSIRAGRNIYQ